MLKFLRRRYDIQTLSVTKIQKIIIRLFVNGVLMSNAHVRDFRLLLAMYEYAKISYLQNKNVLTNKRQDKVQFLYGVLPSALFHH